MKKYELHIAAINKTLKRFSTYLNPDYKIDAVDLNDGNRFLDLKGSSWVEARFPCSDSVGVYFIFGHKKDNDEVLGLYVGKASHHSCFGYRLYAHLHNEKRAERTYPKSDKEGNEFLMELVIVLPMNEIYFLAPALEEFLIYELQSENVYLINAIGRG